MEDKPARLAPGLVAVGLGVNVLVVLAFAATSLLGRGSVLILLLVQAAYVGLVDLKRAVLGWPVVTERMVLEDYLRSQLGEYAAIERLNRTVPPGETVLYAGTFQGFLEVRYRYVDQALRARLDREEYSARARAVGARHLAVLREVADRLGLSERFEETYRDAYRVIYAVPVTPPGTRP